MITFHEALTADRFHEDHEPAGKIFEWRRNGATQTWKTRPGEFRIPVKYGLRSYGQIRQYDAENFHRADQCPTRHVRVSLPEGGEWFGIAVQDDTLNGSVLVHVTTRGASKHRVGSEVDVPAGLVSDL